MRDRVYDVVEILAQDRPLSRALEHAGRVARDGQNVIANAAFQVMLAVREDAVLYAPSGFDGGQEILVQLLDVLGVGRAANHDVALEFDVGVADSQVDALNGSVAGRDFGVNLALVRDNARMFDEVAPGVAYVVLRIAGEMAFEQFAEVIHGGIVLARQRKLFRVGWGHVRSLLVQALDMIGFRERGRPARNARLRAATPSP